MEENKNSNNDNKNFEIDCNENGYGICIRCRINAGPLCDKCFIILRKMNFKKNNISTLERIDEIDE
jgi:hypothetical protein